MKTETKKDLLLFSVQVVRYPYKYRLFFEEITTTKKAPIIHCFYVYNKKSFEGVRIGGLYTLTLSGLKAISLKETGSYNLAPDEYFSLILLRDTIFLDKRTKLEIGMDQPEYHPSDVYYSLSSTRSLIGYRPDRLSTLLYWLSKGLMYLFSIIVPVALYILYVIAISFIAGSSNPSSTRSLSMPIAALCSVPMLFYLMNVIYVFTELIILNINKTRYVQLKAYCLRWGGLRKSCMLEPEQKQTLKRRLWISLGILCIGTILSLLVF